MAWVFLGVAGLLEVVWAYLLKVSDGFSKPVESATAIVAMIGSFWLLSLAMKELPLGTAYAIWTGIGAIGTFALGIALLGEPASAMRLAAAGLIVSGLALMKLSV